MFSLLKKEDAKLLRIVLNLLVSTRTTDTSQVSNIVSYPLIMIEFIKNPETFRPMQQEKRILPEFNQR